MNILYIHQYFHTPSEPGSTRSYWIAKELIDNGHNVTMITSRGEGPKKIVRRYIEGIKVIYLKVPYNQKMGVIDRLRAFSEFMLKATWCSFMQPDIDLVIATSTPLTVGLPALFLRKIKRIPFIFEVRDLWPEVPIQMGGLKNRFLIKIANWFENAIYKNASHIIALSPGMACGVKKKGIVDTKVTVIPNMAKIEKFWPRTKDCNLMLQLGLKRNSFKIIHFGALGLANGARSIIESAKCLGEEDNIEIVFIGGGSTENDLKEECLKFDLKWVHFLGKFPMDKTSEIVNFCDVSIVSFLNLPILYTNSPNKLFDSLSAGKPVIVNSAGWTKVLVERYKCGLYINPNDPMDLVKVLRYLKKSPQLVETMAREARNIAVNIFDKSILCRKFVEVIEHNSRTPIN